VNLIGSIIRIYHDERSPERQFITIHGHLNVRLFLVAFTGQDETSTLVV